MSPQHQENNLDRVESGIVFRVSRVFFWALVGAAGLALIGSVLLLLYSITPTSKQEVQIEPFPPEPSVTLAEIRLALEAKAAPVQIARELGPAPAAEPTPPQLDPLKLRLATLLDTLGMWFPNRWQTIYGQEVSARDWLGRPTAYRTIIVREGFSHSVNTVLERFGNIQMKIDLVTQMIHTCSQFEDEMREKAVRMFVQLTRTRIEEHNQAVASIRSINEAREREAQGQYNAARSRKEESESYGLMGLGSSIVAIALLGLFLCFLAIERNTRALRELVTSQKPVQPPLSKEVS